MQNLLLQRMPANELAELSPGLALVSLAKNHSLLAPDHLNDFVYFPIDAVISFVGNTGQHGTIEVWSAGKEGVAGMAAIFGAANPYAGVVVVPGTGIKAKASTFRRYFNASERCREVVLSYWHDLLVQVSCLSICNNGHPLVQRFSRWLLIMQRRAGSKDLKFTQELIANMLGTRRATISVAAAALQDAGLISYTPGSITIKSRSGLKKMACGCHKVIGGGAWRR